MVQSRPSSATQGEPGPARSDRAEAWAWGICWLMFASTVLNYMDRQAIALVGPEIKAQFGLDNLGFGWVLLAFQLSYAFCQWPAGTWRIAGTSGAPTPAPSCGGRWRESPRRSPRPWGS